jgi:hypothetical protein
MYTNTDTKEELEYYKLLYNFEDTQRFCEAKQLNPIDCKRCVTNWLREVNKILETRKNHTHYKFFLNLKIRMDTFLKRRY